MRKTVFLFIILGFSNIGFAKLIRCQVRDFGSYYKTVQVRVDTKTREMEVQTSRWNVLGTAVKSAYRLVGSGKTVVAYGLMTQFGQIIFDEKIYSNVEGSGLIFRDVYGYHGDVRKLCDPLE